MKISEMSAELRMVFDAMKDQLIIVLVNRLGGDLEIPVDEIDGTGRFNMVMEIDHEARSFTFKVTEKGK